MLKTGEIIHVCIRDAVELDGYVQDCKVQATYDSQYSGVCISPELASRIKKDLGTGTVEALWYEEGRSKSYRDVLQIHNVGVDMVIGKERGTDVEKGRVSIVAPISWKKTSQEKESTRKKQEEARKKASETSADQNRQFLSQQPPSPWEWYDLYSQWHRTVRDNQGHLQHEWAQEAVGEWEWSEYDRRHVRVLYNSDGSSHYEFRPPI